MNLTPSLHTPRHFLGSTATSLAATALLFALGACGDADDAGAGVAAGSGASDASGTTGGTGQTGGAGMSGGAGGSDATGGSGGADSADCATDPGWTVGLTEYDAAADQGYTLFAPLSSTMTYLIDACGREVHSWPGTARPGNSVYLLEDGDLLRTERVAGSDFDAGGTGGRVLRISWDGTITWQYEYATDMYRQHHDVELLPNGNILMIVWQKKTEAEAIAAGRDPSKVDDGEVWVDSIIEVTPQGASDATIEWEWHLWDHLVQDQFADKDNYGSVEDNPQLVDINYGGATKDWNHVNGIDYNPELDQIIVSVHNFGEVWVIDHDTTTAEAAGAAGDLLYRWGNPVVYGAGNPADQLFFGQHDSQWIEPGLPGAGNILVFNNGMGNPDGEFSTVDELEPPVDGIGDYELTTGDAYGPADLSWQYKAPNPTDFYSRNISGAQRLANGNTLICSGAGGRLFEVTEQGAIVWEYISPITQAGPLMQGQSPGGGPMNGNPVFRAYRYAADYEGLAGRDLTPSDYIEQPAN